MHDTVACSWQETDLFDLGGCDMWMETARSQWRPNSKVWNGKNNKGVSSADLSTQSSRG